MPDVLVLGGGIAGLAAAYTAQNMGRAAVILEAAPRAGGLLDSFTVDGFRFDNAVHLSFATEPEVRAVFDRTPWIDHQAVAYCRDDQHWLRHPVQNNLSPLSIEEKVDLIRSFIDRPEKNINTYRDWLEYQYGYEIAERWPLRYTEKYWTVDAGELGIDWIGQRMRRADISEVLRGAMTASVPNTYYVDRMRYPVEGGYRAFIAPLLDAVDVRLRQKVVKIDADRREVITEDGSSWFYHHLISTLPLPVLATMIVDVPDHVVADATSLFATSVDLVSIGLRGEHRLPSLWAYIYDRDVEAARVYSPSSKSADNAPHGCSSLQFEIYSSKRRPQTSSADSMIENAVTAMEKMKIASRADIIFTHHKHVPWANVVFDLGMEARRDRVRQWLKARGVLTAGRFGEWAYLWSNQSFLSGMRAAQSLVPVPH